MSVACSLTSGVHLPRPPCSAQPRHIPLPAHQPATTTQCVPRRHASSWTAGQASPAASCGLLNRCPHPSRGKSRGNPPRIRGKPSPPASGWLPCWTTSEPGTTTASSAERRQVAKTRQGAAAPSGWLPDVLVTEDATRSVSCCGRRTWCSCPCLFRVLWGWRGQPAVMSWTPDQPSWLEQMQYLLLLLLLRLQTCLLISLTLDPNRHKGSDEHPCAPEYRVSHGGCLPVPSSAHTLAD